MGGGACEGWNVDQTFVVNQAVRLARATVDEDQESIDAILASVGEHDRGGFLLFLSYFERSLGTLNNQRAHR